MVKPHLSPRAAAVQLLNGVLLEGKLIAELLAENILAPLAPEARARAQRLALETLRGLERADRLLAKHIRKNPPLGVRNILRLAVVELCRGGDAHGIVNEAVALAGYSKRTASFKGLINAVLRKLAQTGQEDWQKLRVPRLPSWLRQPLVEAYGASAMGAIEQAHFKPVPIDITLKDPARAADWAAQLNGTVLPGGSIRLSAEGALTARPGFASGDWWVQDAAAALPVRLLGDLSGQKALDLCAAPGGKTMQLSAAGASTTALDISQSRLQRLHENLDRTGLMADVIVADARAHGTTGYDVVVLDAPCSATGTIRRHPDLPFAKDGAQFSALFDLQAQLLDHALERMAAHGRLVYCTCSLLPDEGEAQIENALQKHSGLRVDHSALDKDFIAQEWRVAELGLRLRPDFWVEHGGMDGFFITVLRWA
ncbi:16S rRNA methyltransferase [Rhodobacteraceae bacterium IMCC1335]